jgi:hypothetical protein
MHTCRKSMCERSLENFTILNTKKHLKAANFLMPQNGHFMPKKCKILVKRNIFSKEEFWIHSLFLLAKGKFPQIILVYNRQQATTT